MQKEMKKAFVFVMGMMLLTVELTSCKYFKSLDGPGMERDSATLAAMDSMAIKGKEVQSSLTESMQSNLAEPQEDASELTYANMNGVYDSLDEDMNSVSRISLNADGTASWCMVGSLNYTEYIYRIEGNTICMKAKGVDSEEECYEYDSDTHTLKNEQGAVYYRQVAE